MNDVSALSTARLLDLDPDLGAAIPAADRAVARELCRGRVLQFQRGEWLCPGEAERPSGLIGLLVVRGLFTRELRMSDHYAVELLGPHDVLQLPSGSGRPRLANDIRLLATARTTAVALGRSFLAAAARWPGLITEVARRIEIQRERVAVQGLIVHFSRAEHRVLLALWHLAETWGRITPEGTLITLRLTHELLGQLTGSRRPTVTIALRSLIDAGVLRRLDDGAWLLPPEAQAYVETIVAGTDSRRPAAEILMLRHLARETEEESQALRAEAEQLRRRALSDGR